MNLAGEPLVKPLTPGTLVSGLVPATQSSTEEGQADPGYVFVFTNLGLQLFTNDNRAVQVPESYANA